MTTKYTGIRTIIDHVLRNRADNQVVLGPVTWAPKKEGGKQWSFIIATCGKNRGWRCDGVTLPSSDADGAEFYRSGVKVKLLELKPPLIIHDTNDEVYMIRLCSKLWPGERVKRVLENVEAEWRERD